MTDEILKRLDLLAAKLSTTVDHLWGVLLFQARIEAISDGLALVVTLFAAYWVYRWGRWVAKNENQVDDLVWFPIGVLSVALGVIVFAELAYLPTELFNPQYFALHRILESLK